MLLTSFINGGRFLASLGMTQLVWKNKKRRGTQKACEHRLPPVAAPLFLFDPERSSFRAKRGI
jgi:hypothetical protein